MKSAVLPGMAMPYGAEPSSAAAPPSRGPHGEAPATQQFEAFFIAQLFAQMRRTVEAVSQNTSFGSSYFNSMLDEQLAQVTAAAGGFGLAKIVDKDVAGPQVPAPSVDARSEKGGLP